MRRSSYSDLEKYKFLLIYMKTTYFSRIYLPLIKENQLNIFLTLQVKG